jgi:hypothetical protein
MAIVMTTVAGVAFGYVGEWGRGEEPTTHNVIVLCIWVVLLVLLVTARIFDWARAWQISVGAILLGFIFLLFATYRHQQFGNLGDSKMYLEIAAYNYNFGVADQFHISSVLSADLNQALFDAGFWQLWIVPLIGGIAFAAVLAITPWALKTVNWDNIVNQLNTLLLFFLASSCLLYFFRTYMESYTYPSVIMCAGLMISFFGVRLASVSCILVGALTLAVTPLFHLVYALPLGVIALWGLIAIKKPLTNKLKLSWIIGLVIPNLVFVALIAINRSKLFAGNLGWFQSEGFFRNNLANLNSMQVLLLICLASFPLGFLALFNHLLLGPQNYITKTNNYVLALAIALLLAWVVFALVTNFGMTLQRDRDLLIALLMPVVYVFVVTFLQGRPLLTQHQDLALLFSCAVTATVVSSFIEPTFDTSAVLSLLR